MMKYYRRSLDVPDKLEMHFQVDHYLEPFDITEEQIADSIENYKSPLSIRSREEYEKWRDGLAKTFLSLIKGE